MTPHLILKIKIFYRELCINASDAIDKLKLSRLTDEKLKESFASERWINISFDEKNKSLTIVDNGIGMNKRRINSIGTIAKSGN